MPKPYVPANLIKIGHREYVVQGGVLRPVHDGRRDAGR